MDLVGIRRALARGLVLLGLAAGACRLEMTVDLPISAIERVPDETKNTFLIPAEMRIPVPFTDSCTRYMLKFGRPLSKRLKEFEMEGCASNGFSSYIKARFELPLRFLELSEWAVADALLLRPHSMIALAAIRPPDDPPRTSVLLFVSKEGIEELKREIGETWVDTVSLDESQVTVRLINDRGELRKFRVFGVFVADQPRTNIEILDLPAESNISIRLSNVDVSSVLTYGFTPMFSVVDQR